jgi:hypothetical protein
MRLIGGLFGLVDSPARKELGELRLADQLHRDSATLLHGDVRPQADSVARPDKANEPYLSKQTRSMDEIGPGFEHPQT